MHTDRSGRFALHPLAEGSWRVCDSDRAPRDADSLVAYVERDDEGQIHVVWLSGAVHRTRHVSLDEVLDVAYRRAAEASPSRSKPIGIPHRPPPARGRKVVRRAS